MCLYSLAPFLHRLGRHGRLIIDWYRVYAIPGDLFQVPTGYVWIFTARLVTGKGLPPNAREWAFAFAVIFAITTMIRTTATGKVWRSFIPGGIAVAVGKFIQGLIEKNVEAKMDSDRCTGMYNVPSFTLARTVGGLLSWYWISRRGQSSTPLIVLASVRISRAQCGGFDCRLTLCAYCRASF